MPKSALEDILARFRESDPIVTGCQRCGWTSSEGTVDEAREAFAAHRCLEPPPRRQLARRSSR